MRQTSLMLNACVAAAVAWLLGAGSPAACLADPASAGQEIHFQAHLEQPIAGQDDFEKKTVERDWAPRNGHRDLRHVESTLVPQRDSALWRTGPEDGALAGSG